MFAIGWLVMWPRTCELAERVTHSVMDTWVEGRRCLPLVDWSCDLEPVNWQKESHTPWWIPEWKAGDVWHWLTGHVTLNLWTGRKSHTLRDGYLSRRQEMFAIGWLVMWPWTSELAERVTHSVMDTWVEGRRCLPLVDWSCDLEPVNWQKESHTAWWIPG